MYVLEGLMGIDREEPGVRESISHRRLQDQKSIISFQSQQRAPCILAVITKTNPFDDRCARSPITGTKRRPDAPFPKRSQSQNRALPSPVVPVKMRVP